MRSSLPTSNSSACLLTNMDSNTASFPPPYSALSTHTLPSNTRPLLRLPSPADLSAPAVPPLSKNAAGIECYSDYARAACHLETGIEQVQEQHLDRSKPIFIHGLQFRYTGVPISESECSFQSNSTLSSKSVEEEASAGVSMWSAASPTKSILRHPPENSSQASPQASPQASLQASLQASPQASPEQQPLVYDYASTASPASRRVSTVSFHADSRRASAHRRLSFDAGVQVRISAAEEHKVAGRDCISAKKAKLRRSSIASRRSSFGSSIRNDTIAGFHPVGHTDTGAHVCEANGRKFELVVDDVKAEKHIGIQCQPLDIDVEVALLFEEMGASDHEQEDDDDDDVMDVEQVRSAAVLPPFYQMRKVITGNESRTTIGMHANALPHPVPLISLPDAPEASLNSATNSMRSCQHYANSQHDVHIQHDEPRSGTYATTPSARQTGDKDRSSASQRDGATSLPHVSTDASTRSPMRNDNRTIQPQRSSTKLSAPQSIIDGESGVSRELTNDVISRPNLEEEEEDEIVVATSHAARSTRLPCEPALADKATISVDSCVQSEVATTHTLKTPLMISPRKLDAGEHAPESCVHDQITNPKCTASAPVQAEVQTEKRNVHCEVRESEDITGVAILDGEDKKVNIVSPQEKRQPTGTASASDELVSSHSPLNGPGSPVHEDDTAPSLKKQPLPPLTCELGMKENSEVVKLSDTAAPATDVLKPHPSKNNLRFHLNVSQVCICPSLSAYQLAFLRTVTPNTKATLASLRENREPLAVRAVTFTPEDVKSRSRPKLGEDPRINEGDLHQDRSSPKAKSFSACHGNAGRNTRKQSALDPSIIEEVGKNLHSEGADNVIETESNSHWLAVPSVAAGGTTELESSPKRKNPDEFNATSTTLKLKSNSRDDVGFANGEECDEFSDVDKLYRGLISPAPLAKRILNARTANDSEVLAKNDSSAQHVANECSAHMISEVGRVEDVQSSVKSRRTQGSPVNSQQNVGRRRSLHSEQEIRSKAVEEGVEVFDVTCVGGLDNVDFEHEDADYGDGQDAVEEVLNSEIDSVNVRTQEHKLSSSSKGKVITRNQRRRNDRDLGSMETMDEPLLNESANQDDSDFRRKTQSDSSERRHGTVDSESPVVRRKVAKERKKRKVAHRKKKTPGCSSVSLRSRKRPRRELAAVAADKIQIDNDDDGQGVRRSKRQRFPRLKYWKNEVVSYERRVSQMMPTVAEVIVDVGETDSEESWMPKQ